MEALVAAWARSWQVGAAAAVLALWDKTDPESYFLSADSVEAFTGKAVIGVIQRRCLASPPSYVIANLHVRYLSKDVGLAFFTADGVRVTLIARNTGDAWRVFHYAEAPLAPLLELQAYYEKVAADE